jgi:hypothetical protein
MPGVVSAEAIVLTALKAAAERGEYWDTLDRLRTVVADFDMILHNICVKARAAGLVPQLEQLKNEEVTAS